MKKRILNSALIVLITINAYALTDLISHDRTYLQVALTLVLVVASALIYRLISSVKSVNQTADVYRELNYELNEKNDDWFAENFDLKKENKSLKKELKQLKKNLKK